MATSGVIGRHRAAVLTGSRPRVVARQRSRSSRAWLGPLLALLAIAVLPMIGRAVALLTPTASTPASSATTDHPRPAGAPPSAAVPSAAPTTAPTAVPTLPAVPSASSSPAAPRHRAATPTTAPAPAPAPAVVPAPVVAAPPAATGQTTAQAPAPAPPATQTPDVGTQPVDPPTVVSPPDPSASDPSS